MTKPVPRERKREWLLVLALVVGLARTYQALPVTQMSDARYTLLVSTALLEHGDFALESYLGGTSPQPMPLPLATTGGHLLYRYPPLTPILAVPYVWWQAQRGNRPLDAHGQYSAYREEALQRALAAWLVAVTCGLLYWLVRALVPPGWSLVLTLVAGLGTPLLSTASRALWNQTAGTMLCVLVLLAMQRLNRRAWSTPVLLGTLTAWLYASRPTWSVLVAAVGLWWLHAEHTARPEPPRRWLLLILRRQPLLYTGTVLVWLVPFVAYAWTYGHHPLPAYYRSAMHNPAFLEAVAANLVSPARGVLVYCPFLIPAAVLLRRRWSDIRQVPLTQFALAYLAVHLVVISLNVIWWGGGAYGPRFMTDVVPLGTLLLAAVLADWRRQPGRDTRLLLATGLLVPVAVAMHGNGAVNAETWEWNRRPIGEGPSAPMWRWDHPQFLAGRVMPVPPLPAAGRVNLGASPGAWPFLLRGWWGPEPGGAWTREPVATLRFSLPPGLHPTQMTLPLQPAVPVDVDVRVNDVPLWHQHLTGPTTAEIDVRALPELGAVGQTWTLEVVTDQTVRPEVLGLNQDRRTLGVKVGWVAIQ